LANKISTVRFLLAVILVNTIGFTLKYFGLDTHIIILGFRFHFAAIIAIVAVIKKNHFILFKESFLKPQFVRVGRVIITFIGLNFLFISILFLIKEIEIGDPEYFYEFGLSSIVDYPIYLIWNSIQLILLYFLFLIIQKSFRYNFIIVLAMCILLFVYEFIPVKEFVLDYESVGSFLLLCFIAAVTIKYYNNIYLFIILIFSSIWFSVLTFGSSSSIIVNIFFAANYNSWEGFLTVDKTISYFIIPAYYFLMLISLLILALINKRKSV
jgi:hypothetical protein